MLVILAQAQWLEDGQWWPKHVVKTVYILYIYQYYINSDLVIKVLYSWWYINIVLCLCV
jgi:hypothetical protein